MGEPQAVEKVVDRPLPVEIAVDHHRGADLELRESPCGGDFVGTEEARERDPILVPLLEGVLLENPVDG